MGSVTTALTYVAPNELGFPTGTHWAILLGQFAYKRYEHRFVRPLLEARDVTDVDRRLRQMRFSYLSRRFMMSAFLVAVQPWDHLSLDKVRGSYDDIQKRLEAKIFDEDLTREVDYVAYTATRALLAIVKVRGKANPVKPDLVRLFKVSATFDALFPAVFLAVEEPEAVQSMDAFRGLVRRAVEAGDDYIASLSDYGFLPA